MEYYFLWHLSQYSDSLDPGPLCGLFRGRSKRLTFYPEHQTSPWPHMYSHSVDVVDPSPALKQLMRVIDHSFLFPAEVADQFSCNCASPE